MKSYLSNMPAWVTILFIICSFVPIVFIAKTAKQAALNAGMILKKSQNVQYGIYIFYILWIAYVWTISIKGVLYVNTMPPRVIIFTTLPLFIILLGIVYNTKLYKKLLESATLDSLISMHIFRVLGVFFVMFYFYNLLTPEFALSAGLGDIATALFALPVSRFVAKKKSWSWNAAFAWNVFGLLDIINLMTIATLVAKHSVETGNNLNGEMTLFPFVWFPAFAAATLVFLHIGVFKKLKQIRSKYIAPVGI